ncbi:MAG: YqaJ viral recombinase family protein [Porphyrobacter sp.]|nr:YqaJ viral recombinase family protein [Porphyrobacter sp.]
MTRFVIHHDAFEQGSEQWLQARCGLLTASEIKLILTPTLKLASNDKERQHLFELAAQRITGHVEPRYISDDMLRGQEDEIIARDIYSRTYAPVHECGFITNTRHGFTLGYSPDGLVGEHGLIECKSRRQKYQAETLIRHVPAGTVPDDFMLQCQSGLLAAERQWLDFISYCGGMPMCVIRCWPDDRVQAAIIEAAAAAEARIAKLITEYSDVLGSGARLIATERRIEQEMMI